MPETYDLSPSQAAEQLGVHVDTVKRWARGGTVPAIRTPGGWWRFNADELAAWLDAQHNASGATAS